MRWAVITVVLVLTSCADDGVPAADVDLRVQEVRSRIIRVEAGIDAASATRIEAVLDGYQEEQRGRDGEVRQARRELNRLLREDSQDQDAYARALARLSKAHESAHEMRHARFEAIVENLQPRDAARLLHALGRHHPRRGAHPPPHARPPHGKRP